MNEISDGEATARSEEPADPGFRPAAALAFWFCLSLAASLFAAVVLAPKLRIYRELSREYDGLARTLASAECKVDALQKVADALQSDPQFAEELARADFDASAPDEERIPVDSKLSLGRKDPASALLGNGHSSAGDAPRPEDLSRATPFNGGARPFGQKLLETPLLEPLANDHRVRGWLLGLSCALVLFAFTFLCEGGAQTVDGDKIGWRTRFRRWTAQRYTG